MTSSLYTPDSDETPEQRQKRYLKKQKRRLAVAIVILVALAALMLTWKLYSADRSRENLKNSQQSRQVDDIQSRLDAMAASDGQAASTTDSKQQAIIRAIRSSQPLPVRIDDITTIDNVYFQANSLIFEISISNASMKPEDQDKMRNPDTINLILEKNRPVACSLMKKLNGWEGDWTIGYRYFFQSPRQQIGSIVFRTGQC